MIRWTTLPLATASVIFFRGKGGGEGIGNQTRRVAGKSAIKLEVLKLPEVHGGVPVPCLIAGG